MFAETHDGSTAAAARADAVLAAAARADSQARARLAAAIDDLFLAEEARPDERQRLAMVALLARLVASIEDDLRQRLGSLLSGSIREEILVALGTARLAIAAPILEDAGALRDPELVAVLAVRVGEHRLAEILRRPGGPESVGAAERPEPWIDSGDPAIAEAAMALLIAESRRIDQLHQPLVGCTDLPADLQHRLTWRIAAALRRWLIEVQSVSTPQADAAIAEAARASLAVYDEGEALEPAAMRLALELTRAGSVDPDLLLARALDDGRPAPIAALVALRAAVPFDVARQALLEPDGARLTVLLRAGSVGREVALALLQTLGDAHGQPPLAELPAYDLIDAVQARAAALPWRIDPGYRAAIAELEGGKR